MQTLSGNWYNPWVRTTYERARMRPDFEFTATKAEWNSPEATELKKARLTSSPLHSLPAALQLLISDEIQAESLRPIQLIRRGTHLNINYGTIIKIPLHRPTAGYTNEIYKVMELMDLVKPANGGWMCAQEQIDWIKIAGKSGFKKP